MSDNITFYLSDKGYNVAKYLPYGPVKMLFLILQEERRKILLLPDKPEES
jgi:proline dehydrogenase